MTDIIFATIFAAVLVVAGAPVLVATVIGVFLLLGLRKTHA